MRRQRRMISNRGEQAVNVMGEDGGHAARVRRDHRQTACSGVNITIALPGTNQPVGLDGLDGLDGLAAEDSQRWRDDRNA